MFRKSTSRCSEALYWYVNILYEKQHLKLKLFYAVIFVINDPCPGWNANMNGPFGLTTAACKGKQEKNQL